MNKFVIVLIAAVGFGTAQAQSYTGRPGDTGSDAAVCTAHRLALGYMFAQRGDTELADKLQTQARQSQRIAQDWLGPEQSDRVITTVFKRDVAGYHAAGNQARGFEPIRAEIRACDAGLINGVR